ncbi:MAG: gamma-glutamylcyclotransferase [Mesorhizobium sp.]|nr:gamma-glutamylcyclotransferase family protein [Mesorhizobium sp.]MBN9244526.1 gamma-glutamylcyclotransferase [Mesorhizobium sp.]ODU54317.1 MAG: UDP-N-acetylmuramate--alanine ligase [Acetobacteraceae bacterium SCN 69-10]
MPFLFSYGTLRYPQVQRATFGRELEGRPDALPGFARTMVAITDPEVIAKSGEASHPIVRHTGRPADEIDGVVFEITDDELAAADRYEVADYKRVAVRLRSGVEAFVYVDAAG